MSFNETIKAALPDYAKDALARKPAPHPAQPQQEPVYVYTCKGCKALFWENDLSCDCTVNGLFEFDRHVLSEDTSPPAQRTWVGLTDDEILYCVELENPKAIAEEVEAKLKEKNT